MLFRSGIFISCLVGGVMLDKYRPFNVILIGLGLLLLSGCSLILSNNLNELIGLFAISYGLSLSVIMIAPAFLVGRLFKFGNYPSKMGMSNLFLLLGIASGSIVFSEVANYFGYVKAWIVVIVAIIVGSFLLLSTILKIKNSNL